MNRMYTKLKSLAAALLVIAPSVEIFSQSCTFSGLNSSYCLNSPSTALTTTATNVTFYGSPGVIGNAFVPSAAGIGTHTVSLGVCTSSYNMTQYTLATAQFTPNFLTGSSEVGVSLGDDQVSGAIPIGFNFKFYCNNYLQCYISSNGFISFSPNATNGCCSGGSIPTSGSPDDFIAMYWEDLYPPGGGTITYATLGTAPTRTFIMSFNNVPHFSSGNNVTGQIQLHETSNRIVIVGLNLPSDGGTHTQGIENSTGTAGQFVSGRNAANFSLVNDIVIFDPIYTACGTLTTVVHSTLVPVTGNTLICSGQSTTLTATGGTAYAWTGGTSSSNAAIIVSPTSNTSYSVSSTNSIGCTATRVVSVTVNGSAPLLTITPSTNSVCIGKTVTLTASGAASYTWGGGITNGGTVMPSATTIYSVTGSNACGNTTAAVTITATPIPVGLSATPTLVCAGSAATINAVAAATSYTWSSNSQNQSSVTVAPTVNTVYSVAVSDGTCFGSGTVAIAASPVPTITIAASSSVLCQGYSATLTASGASGYTWNPGNLNTAQIIVNPSSATLYSVVGSNTVNCTSIAQQVILTQPSPTLVPTISNTLSCVNETVTISLTGASTYTWSNGMTGNSNVVTVPSSTSIVITGIGSNSCTANYTANLTVFDPTVSVTGGTAVCAGKSTTLTGSGADTYNWVGGLPFASQPVTPSVTTTYTLSTTTASDGVTCSKDVTYTVIVNQNPTITTTPSVVTMCVKSEQATLTASGASSYLWSGNSGTLSANASNTFTYNVAGTYVYSVTGTDANGCVSTKTVSIKVNSCTGINEVTGDNGVEVYPNPNNGEFTVKSSIETDVIMVNQLGQVIREFHLTGNAEQKINVSGIAAGVYYLKSKNNDSFNQKIIVNH